MSITDHPGIAVAYDHRTRQILRKMTHRRLVTTGYFDFLPNVQSGVRNAALRDFESKAESSRKEKGGLKTAKESEAKTRTGKGTVKAGRANAKAAPMGKQWTEGDWAAWKKKKRGRPRRRNGRGRKTGREQGGRQQKEVISTPPPANGPPHIVRHTDRVKTDSRTDRYGL